MMIAYKNDLFDHSCTLTYVLSLIVEYWLKKYINLQIVAYFSRHIY